MRFEERKLYLGIELIAVQCGECGGVYAVNRNYFRQRQEQGGYWNCPYCRVSWGFSKNDSEVARLRKAAQSWERHYHNVSEELVDTRNSLRATKAAKTRLKKRVAAGVCPCCRRTFQNLARHMATEHPSYGGDDDQ